MNLNYNMTKSMIIIPDELDKKIKIYQAKKQIRLKKDAIIQILLNYMKTDEGKKLTQ